MYTMPETSDEQALKNVGIVVGALVTLAVILVFTAIAIGKMVS